MGLSDRLKSGLSWGASGAAASGGNPFVTGGAALAGMVFGGGGGNELPSYADMYTNMQDFQLPSQFGFDPATQLDPYMQTSIRGLNDAYGASLSGLQGAISQYQGGPGYSALQSGSRLARKGFNQAYQTREKGEAGLQSEMDRIGALEAGGYDIFSDPLALAEIAPELTAGARALNTNMEGLDAWGVRGGVGAAQRADLVRGTQSQAQLDLQNAIRQNRATKLGISEARAGRDALRLDDPFAMAMASGDQFALSQLGQLYGNRARDYAGLYGNYFTTGAGMAEAAQERALRAFNMLQSGELTMAEAQSELDANERDALNQLMAEAGEAASTILDKPPEPMTMPAPGSAPLTQPINAAGGFYSPSMPVGSGPDMGTNLRVHPGEEVSVVPASRNLMRTSDARAKDDPGRVRSALKDVSKLPVYDYHYNALAGELDGTPGRGLMAQDLEKNPRTAHLVRKDPETGLRSVDVYGVASTALAAVKELDDKIKRLERKKWRISGRKVA